MYKILIYFFTRKKNPLIHLNKTHIKAFFLFLGLFWYSASGYLYFELPAKPDLSWLDAFWWTFVTMTTVGYGDLFPETMGGRFFVGIPVMIFGIGFLGFIISQLASKLIESRSRRLKGMLKIKAKNHIIITNYRRAEDTLRLIEELHSDNATKNKSICLIDESLEELPRILQKKGLLFVKGNPSSESVLEQANIKWASHVIILSKDNSDPRSDDQNLAITLVVEKLCPGVFSIAEVIDPKKVHILELAGCDSVVCVSDLTSNLIVQELQDPGVKDVIHDITSNLTGQQLYFLPIQSEKSAINYRELVLWGLENKFSVLGIVRDKTVNLNCDSNFQVQNNDKVIVIGNERVKAVEI